MNSHSSSPFDSGPFSPETRAEIARRFGGRMADVVTEAVARALREVAAGAQSAGLPPETAVAGFLHLCREICESIREAKQDGGERLN